STIASTATPPGTSGSSGSRQARAASTVQRRRPGVSASGIGHQCQGAQAGMPVLRAAARADPLTRQGEAIAAAFAFGLDHPAGESADARFVGQAGEAEPVELEFALGAGLVFAHQQALIARR